MPPLSAEEYGAGRQIKRGDTTLDVLDVLQGNNGGQFLVARTGDTVEVVPVAVLRDEETDYEAVDEEKRQAARQQAEEDRQRDEAEQRQQFQEWQRQQAQRGDQPSADPPRQDSPPPPSP